jgi:hypothetical protein
MSVFFEFENNWNSLNILTINSKSSDGAKFGDGTISSSFTIDFNHADIGGGDDPKTAKAAATFRKTPQQKKYPMVYYPKTKSNSGSIIQSTLLLTVSTSEVPVVAAFILVTGATIAIGHDLWEKIGGKSGFHTSIGQSTIPPYNEFDPNNHFYKPGNTPPKWFWPAIGGATTYQMYKNWPKNDKVKPIVIIKE